MSDLIELTEKEKMVVAYRLAAKTLRYRNLTWEDVPMLTLEGFRALESYIADVIGGDLAAHCKSMERAWGFDASEVLERIR